MQRSVVFYSNLLSSFLTGVYWADLGLSETCVLPFDIFYEWWTSDVGMKFVPNASMMLSSSSESKSSKNITKYEYK
jgi:hypothetical protein